MKPLTNLRLRRGALRILAFAVAALLLAAPARARAEAAPGGLLVAPTRVVFEGDRRTAALTLVNTGTRTATYRITFVQMKMTANGQIVTVPDDSAAAWRADRLVRYSPRQVTLEPRAPQTVRLQLRLPADLPPGEYRSHLVFRAIPDVAAPEAVTPADSSRNGAPVLAQRVTDRPAPSGARVARGAKRRGGPLTIELTSVFGVAIPVIVRSGETHAEATLSGARLKAGPTTEAPFVLGCQLGRTGNRSVYGDLVVEHLDARGQATVVTRVDGLAVYTSTPFRQILLPLRPPPGHALHGGRLRIRYAADDEDEPLAETDLPLD